jgi:hypothetical protein
MRVVAAPCTTSSLRAACVDITLASTQPETITRVNLQRARIRLNLPVGMCITSAVDQMPPERVVSPVHLRPIADEGELDACRWFLDHRSDAMHPQ